MLNIFLISVICVIIIDISGVVDHIKSAIKRLLTGGRMSDPGYELRPIDCSFCMTFWTGLVYLILSGTISFWMITYLLLVCVMTPVTGYFIIQIRDLFIKIIRVITNEEI